MRHFTKEFKEKIINKYQQGYSCKEIKLKYGVSKTCLYDWLRLYKVRVHKNKSLFTYKQYENLQKQLEKVSRELEIIKTTNCLPSSPRKQIKKQLKKIWINLK